MGWFQTQSSHSDLGSHLLCKSCVTLAGQGTPLSLPLTHLENGVDNGCCHIRQCRAMHGLMPVTYLALCPSHSGLSYCP